MTRTTKEQLIEFAGDEPEERSEKLAHWVPINLIGLSKRALRDVHRYAEEYASKAVALARMEEL